MIGFFIVGISGLLVRVAVKPRCNIAPVPAYFEMPIVYRGNVLGLSTAGGWRQECRPYCFRWRAGDAHDVEIIDYHKR